VLVDLIQQDSEGDLFLTALDIPSCLRVDVGCGNMVVVAARGLIVLVLELVVGHICGDFLQIPENRLGILDGKVSQKPAAIFPEFDIGGLDQILDH